MNASRDLTPTSSALALAFAIDDAQARLDDADDRRRAALAAYRAEPTDENLAYVRTTIVELVNAAAEATARQGKFEIYVRRTKLHPRPSLAAALASSTGRVTACRIRSDWHRGRGRRQPSRRRRTLTGRVRARVPGRPGDDDPPPPPGVAASPTPKAAP